MIGPAQILSGIIGIISTYFLLFGALAVGLLLALSAVSERLDRMISRVAVAVFGTSIDAIGWKKPEHRRRLRSAHFPTTYRQYASKTLLYAVGGALVGGIIGIYLIWGILRMLALEPATIREQLPATLSFLANFAGIGTLEPLQLIPLLIVSALTVGAVSGGLIHWLRWWYPGSIANARQRQIEATLPQVVAFMYALSKSGMEFPQVMRILASHRRIYGAAAEEIGVAVRHMDVFGRDTVTALRIMGNRTANNTFKEFAENLGSVLQSGRNLESFLDDQYTEFQEEAEAQQEQLLTQLATLAEVYVTLFVAAPLFLITVLVIIGIAGANTLQPLRIIVYLGIPLGNVAFLLYLDSVMEGFGQARRIDRPEQVFSGVGDVAKSVAADRRAETDGGVTQATETARANLERLDAYKQLRRVREILADPIGTITDRPLKILYVTIPLAVIVTAGRIVVSGSLAVTYLDDLLVQAALFVIGSFAIAYEIHRRRLEAIEGAIPDFLARMASVNQAGMSLIDSIKRIRESDLGALNPEINRLWADIQWGATIETAFQRLEYRVRTQTVSRIVTLITNAMSASGNIARVLAIAADQAKADRTLKRKRRQEMLTYLVVIYVAFGVFLIIITAFDQVLLPSLPEEGIVPDTGNGPTQTPGTGFLGEINTANLDAFAQVFRHAALVQAAITGFVAGQMSHGDIKAGAKHSAILLLIAYIGIWVIQNTGVF